MKVTFPHLGDGWIAFKALLEEIGLQVVVPPEITKKTINLGAKYSPEFVCFPFKVTLGNYIEALNQGADTLLALGGRGGNCRFGFYHKVQERILRDLGYEFRMIVVTDVKGLPTLFRKTLPKQGKRRLLRALYLLWWKAKVLKMIDDLTRKIRPVEEIEGDVDRKRDIYLRFLDSAKKVRDVKRVAKVVKEEFRSIPKKSIKPLRIGMVGEFYVNVEPHVNLDIEKQLGRMGCEVHQHLSLYKWLKLPLHIDLERVWNARRAKPYLKVCAGAEDQQTIGHIIQYAKSGYDGVVMLLPFTCLPENIARTFLPELSRRYNIPIITFSFDEQTADTGVRTRLEAFVDLIREKRR
jgi:predicted nucleotide-binding protein (sugar kinase/HSP70/actin superfamily)